MGYWGILSFNKESLWNYVGYWWSAFYSAPLRLMGYRGFFRPYKLLKKYLLNSLFTVLGRQLVGSLCYILEGWRYTVCNETVIHAAQTLFCITLWSILLVFSFKFNAIWLLIKRSWDYESSKLESDRCDPQNKLLSNIMWWNQSMLGPPLLCTMNISVNLISGGSKYYEQRVQLAKIQNTTKCMQLVQLTGIDLFFSLSYLFPFDHFHWYPPKKRNLPNLLTSRWFIFKFGNPKSNQNQFSACPIIFNTMYGRQ